jgi:predicted cupin superfamily sugar epimerase
MSVERRTAAEIVRLLGLQPHPEGGHFRETFRDTRMTDGRSASTLIYFLLAKGERSHWHRVDAVEIWHFYAGSPLALHYAASDHTPPASVTLGNDISQTASTRNS